MIFFAKTSDIFCQHSDLSSYKSSLEKKKQKKIRLTSLLHIVFFANLTVFANKLFRSDLQK